jgi:hypothetical protein
VLPEWLVRCKSGRLAKTYAGHEGSLGQEQRLYFSLRVTMAAPLIAGSDIAAMSDRLRRACSPKRT